jgi:hypothetical protein
MGLREGNPEKDGVLVDLDSLPLEMKTKLDRKKARVPREDGEVVKKLVALDMET